MYVYHVYLHAWRRQRGNLFHCTGEPPGFSHLQTRIRLYRLQFSRQGVGLCIDTGILARGTRAVLIARFCGTT